MCGFIITATTPGIIVINLCIIFIVDVLVRIRLEKMHNLFFKPIK